MVHVLWIYYFRVLFHKATIFPLYRILYSWTHMLAVCTQIRDRIADMWVRVDDMWIREYEIQYEEKNGSFVKRYLKVMVDL
uniref:Uncharacterized protein n=1 Tax=Arundo donax TaxID=35708 RepID=A0A0A9HY00_ARUDO